VPEEDLIWQDPLPAASGPTIDGKDVAVLKQKIIDAGISPSQLESAWTPISSTSSIA